MSEQKHRYQIGYAILGFILLLMIDQISKALAVRYLAGTSGVSLIPGVFELSYLENQGAAFGLFQNRQLIFEIGAVLMVLVVAYFYGKIPATKRFIPMRICAVLLSAGAVGNLIDRLRLHYVVDFFYFSLIDFPIFNVADSYVVIGCFLFIILILFVYQDEELNFFSIRKK